MELLHRRLQGSLHQEPKLVEEHDWSEESSQRLYPRWPRRGSDVFNRLCCPRPRWINEENLLTSFESRPGNPELVPGQKIILNSKEFVIRKGVILRRDSNLPIKKSIFRPKFP